MSRARGTEEGTIPVISLWMPWANWVSLGWKTIETRLHRRFSSLAGKTIGIHCSLKWDDTALDAARDFLSPDQVTATGQFLRVGGAIICTAEVQECRELDPLDNARALIDCTHVTRYGLILRNIQTIEAIPCRGKQGIWYIPNPNLPTSQDERER